MTGFTKSSLSLAGLKPPIDPAQLTNKGELKSFLKTALAWRGTVTPRVIPRVLITAMFSLGVVTLIEFFPILTVSMTPFEYSGAFLGLLLVLRVNAGLDRWWEARKIWGSIVNQSRNLALAGYGYSRNASDSATAKNFLRWTASWPHIMRESLRREKDLIEVSKLLGLEEAEKIRKSVHMPTYAGARIIQLIKQLRQEGMDDFAFIQVEKERALLIDAIGACERIRNTPMPFVLAVKIRRFILLFLLFLPFCLTIKLGWFTPVIVALVAYPLFSLDEIGAELQNPFSPRNLSHLPLNEICYTIEKNVMSLELSEPPPAELKESK
jgi:putative membrane protein